MSSLFSYPSSFVEVTISTDTMRATRNIILVITVLTALAVGNFMAARHHARVDLTDKSVYTLAPATRELLRGLDDVITIRMYFSGAMPQPLMGLTRGVRDLIEEFKSAGGAKIAIEYLDPAANARDEQRAMMLGITPVQLNVIERDRRELAKVYLGMAVMYGERLEVIPVVQSVANLEYLLAAAILKVTTKEEISIGFMGPDDEKKDPVGGGFAGLKALLGERYKVVAVDPATQDDLTPENFKTVIVAAPGELGAATLFALDQYLMRGGALVALVDRWTVNANLTAVPKKTDMVDLLARWGVTVHDDLVLDRSNAMASFAGQLMTYHVPYPLWIAVRPENFSKDDATTNELSSLTLPWTSSLMLGAEISAAHAVTLARSTEMAALTSGASPTIEPEAAGKELLAVKETAAYALAFKLKGPFVSAYAEGGLVRPEGAAGVGVSDESAQLIVVGDSRFAQDNFLKRFSENAVFLENVIDAAGLGTKLIGIRSRLGADRPIALISDGEKTILRALAMAIGPMLVVTLGGIVLMARRYRRRKVRAVFV